MTRRLQWRQKGVGWQSHRTRGVFCHLEGSDREAQAGPALPPVLFLVTLYAPSLQDASPGLTLHDLTAEPAPVAYEFGDIGEAMEEAERIFARRS
jgi:hypothetical protein